MTSLDHYLASRQCLWDKTCSSGNDFVSVSEIFQSRRPESDHQTLHRTLRNDELQSWLEDPTDSPSVAGGSNGKRRVLRVVWIPYDKRSGVNDVGDGVLEHLTLTFNHELAQARFRATFHGAGSVAEPSTGRRAFYFCKHPYLAVTWSQDSSSGLTSVICIAQQKKIDILRDLVSCRFIQVLAALAHVPALMCSILCYREIDGLMNNIKQQIRQTEVRTGHHRFTTRVERPATGELLMLSAEMSGCLSRLANFTRRLGIMRELGKFTLEEVERMRHGANSSEENATIDEFVMNVKSIQDNSILQKLDTECFTFRAQIQQDAVSSNVYTLGYLPCHRMVLTYYLDQASHCFNGCFSYSGARQGYTLRCYPHKERLGKYEGSCPYSHVLHTAVICLVALKHPLIRFSICR